VELGGIAAGGAEPQWEIENDMGEAHMLIFEILQYLIKCFKQ
jgi:hypothetical protein